MILSYVVSSASSFWRLPIDEEIENDEQTIAVRSEHIGWLPRPRSPEHIASSSQSSQPPKETLRTPEIHEVLSSNDLYHILGVPRSPTIDRLTLRRAYLSRSKACHPDKFPDNPDATFAFQKVSVAYDVLSKPSSKRVYDSRPSYSQCDFFSSRSASHADETLKGVLFSIISDFLDGDLEMIRTLLRAISDLNPSLKLGDDGINSVLAVLQGIRERVLTCRACLIALHTELIRVLELQSAFHQLPYSSITARSRLTIQLTRITLSLPFTLERAIQESSPYSSGSAAGQTPTNHERENIEGSGGNKNKKALLPRRVVLLIRGIDVILDRMERILG